MNFLHYSTSVSVFTQRCSVGVQTRDRVRRGSSRTINENDNLQFQEISIHIKIEVHDLWLRKGEKRLLS